jgi:transposase
MLTLPSSVRIWACTTPVDLRKSFDGLAALVETVLSADPLSGHLFVFRNKSGDRLKILFWDRDGLVIYYKRLEAGTFALPPSADGVSVEMPAHQLAMVLGGVDLAGTRQRKRYQRPA